MVRLKIMLPKNYKYRPIGFVGRVFASGPGNQGSIPWSSYIKDSIYIYWPYEQRVRQWSVRPGFYPRLNHTKDSENGT